MFQTVVSSQTAAKTTRQQEHSYFEPQKDTFGGKATLNWHVAADFNAERKTSDCFIENKRNPAFLAQETSKVVIFLYSQ